MNYDSVCIAAPDKVSGSGIESGATCFCPQGKWPDRRGDPEQGGGDSQAHCPAQEGGDDGLLAGEAGRPEGELLKRLKVNYQNFD